MRKESILCGYVSATLYLLLDQKIHRGYSSSMPFLNMIGYQDSMQKVMTAWQTRGVYVKVSGTFSQLTWLAEIIALVLGVLEQFADQTSTGLMVKFSIYQKAKFL